MLNLCYTYAGIVEDTQDPLKLGRLKVRVPHVYGSNVSGTGYIGVNDLPWAMPAGMPAGGSSASGGFSHLPGVGDKVYVRFLDGEPEKPIWEWGMQSTTDAASLKLHEYASGTPFGLPDRSILTRYGNSVEITANRLTATTKEGYQLLLEGSRGASGGSASLLTPAGQKVSLNDTGKSAVIQALEAAVVSASNVILNAADSAMIRASRHLSLMVGGTLIAISGKHVTLTTGTGASVIIDDNGNVTLLAASGASVSLEGTMVKLLSPDATGALVVENGKISLSATEIVVNTEALSMGTAAGFPVVMLTPELLAWIIGHTHTSSTPGSPTGPPIPTLPPKVIGSARMQTT